MFKKLTAIAAVAALAAMPALASAAGLMNVTQSSSSTLSGNISSHTTSWDNYAGVQLSVSETSSKEGAIGADLTGLGPNPVGGNLNLYGQKSQNFAAQIQLTFFKGGDSSDVYINGHINQAQTSFATGIQTTFGN